MGSCQLFAATNGARGCPCFALERTTIYLLRRFEKLRTSDFTPAPQKMPKAARVGVDVGSTFLEVGIIQMNLL